MLYLESPRGVGFSYRDATAPEDTEFNDDKVTQPFFFRFCELYLLLFYFFIFLL